MKTFTAKIIDPIGLHARPASQIVALASQFKSDITIVSNQTGKSANLKSLMMAIALNLRNKDSFTVKANGEDEEQAIEVLQKAFADNDLI
ncbi:HPr family phosphocarrier protein [Mycoplasmopsis iners]|uniref:HPr family phosphocarrier protein n=1 Tax=Mycoplasmopsis iners TaxID=76630 RepID=UPI0004954695|nr:HPr family phosphocarrier protein [Mycoplasmopsis iners]